MVIQQEDSSLAKGGGGEVRQCREADGVERYLGDGPDKMGQRER